VRKEIAHLVKIINTNEYDDFMAVRLSRDILDLQGEVTLVNIYDSPENSSYKNTRNKLYNEHNASARGVKMITISRAQPGNSITEPTARQEVLLVI
jgi:hypothetical protein